MKVAAGILAGAVVFSAVSCANSESSTSPLPAYTATPADIYGAYSAGLDDLDAGLDVLHKARSAALEKLEAAPDLVFDAVQEARGCDVHIDTLTNDPRDLLTAIVGIPADPQMRSAREAPRLIAHDIAAAHVASPANRSAVEDVRSALVLAQMTGKPPTDDPVIEAYLDFLRNDPALANYESSFDELNKAYLPVNDDLNAARVDLVRALIQASEIRECTGNLLVAMESYMAAYDMHRLALLAYLDGIEVAIKNYADALELARAPYVQR